MSDKHVFPKYSEMHTKLNSRTDRTANYYILVVFKVDTPTYSGMMKKKSCSQSARMPSLASLE